MRWAAMISMISFLRVRLPPGVEAVRAPHGVAEDEAEHEGRTMVERLKDLLPKQQFAQALQAKVRGRIIARETIPAQRKDVTGYLYGGDVTRKMKLLEKQKRGKKKMLARGKVDIPEDVFMKMVRSS